MTLRKALRRCGMDGAVSRGYGGPIRLPRMEYPAEFPGTLLTAEDVLADDWVVVLREAPTIREVEEVQRQAQAIFGASVVGSSGEVTESPKDWDGTGGKPVGHTCERCGQWVAAGGVAAQIEAKERRAPADFYAIPETLTAEYADRQEQRLTALERENARLRERVTALEESGSIYDCTLDAMDTRLTGGIDNLGTALETLSQRVAALERAGGTYAAEQVTPIIPEEVIRESQRIRGVLQAQEGISASGSCRHKYRNIKTGACLICGNTQP